MRKTLEIPDKKEQEELPNSKTKVTVDPNIAKLKVRFQGFKKVYSLEFEKSDMLQSILGELKEIERFDGDLSDVQITCAAKRIIFSCTPENCEKSLDELGLYPVVSIVIQLPSDQSMTTKEKSTTTLADRAKINREKKKGSHTMQSTGIYSTNDGAKGELIDGGSGVLWEHDITDDEEEEAEVDNSAKGSDGEVDATDESE